MTTNPRTRILNDAADAAQRAIRCQTYAESNGVQNTIDFIRRLAADTPATTNPSVITDRVLSEVLAERIQQDEKWGEQNHRDGTSADRVWAFTGPAAYVADCARMNTEQLASEGYVTWLDIALEEFAEVAAESDPQRLRAELLQVAAVAVAWIEAIDRRTT